MQLDLSDDEAAALTRLHFRQARPAATPRAAAATPGLCAAASQAEPETAAVKSYRGAPITLGAAVTAQVRLVV